MSDSLNTPIMLLKNSLNIKTPEGARTPIERTRYLPRKLLEDSENDPPSSMISPSKYAVVRQLATLRPRFPLEDHDANSQDSGISEDSKSSEFRFAEPCGAAPRRMSSIDMSPRRLLASPLRSPKFGTPDRLGMSPRVRRTKLPEMSPKRALSFSCDSATSLTSFSSESTEDGFLDLFQNDKLLDEDAQLPGSGLDNLLSAQILTNATPPRSPPKGVNFQRSLSECLSPTKDEVFSLKRPLLLSSHSVDASTPLSKRHKPLGACQDINIIPQNERGTLFQYGFKKTSASSYNSGWLSPPHSITPEPTSPQHSEASEHSIKLGFLRSATEELIGDFSKKFALPLISSKEHDLKTISCETLAKVIKGEYANTVSSFKIIDCRYPYEYEGGHIKGSVNLYRQDQITQELQSRQRLNSIKSSRKRVKQLTKNIVNQPIDELTNRLIEEKSAAPVCDDDIRKINEHSDSLNKISPLNKEISSDSDDSDSNSRHIVIFHCEYSAERGPSLFRWLRQEDRAINAYPTLAFPELYLLEGGYKAFFSSFSELCEPRSYTPMNHPEHTQDLRNFRAKSKSWAGKHHKKLSVRNLSRLGF